MASVEEAIGGNVLLSSTASNSCCDGETETSSLSSSGVTDTASTTVAGEGTYRTPSLGMPRAERWFRRYDSSKMRRSASAHNPQAGI